MDCRASKGTLLHRGLRSMNPHRGQETDMKKSNVLVFSLLLIISVFLIWLWFYLEFDHVDSPLDLALSIAWWVVMAIALAVIVRIEKTRRYRIRTLYVSPGAFFNAEAGQKAYEGVSRLVDAAEAVLKGLRYDFGKTEFPRHDELPVTYLIRTDVMDDETWEGEVVSVCRPDDPARPFTNRNELAAILGSMDA